MSVTTELRAIKNQNTPTQYLTLTRINLNVHTYFIRVREFCATVSHFLTANNLFLSLDSCVHNAASPQSITKKKWMSLFLCFCCGVLWDFVKFGVSVFLPHFYYIRKSSLFYSISRLSVYLSFMNYIYIYCVCL